MYPERAVAVLPTKREARRRTIAQLLAFAALEHASRRRAQLRASAA
jgi:hypothetical protein